MILYRANLPAGTTYNAGMNYRPNPAGANVANPIPVSKPAGANTLGRATASLRTYTFG